MREEERSLFPLSTIGNVVHLFRLELTDDHHDPDIVLLSIVVGCIETSLTSPRTGAVSEVGDRIFEISGETTTLLRMATCFVPVSPILRSLR